MPSTSTPKILDAIIIETAPQPTASIIWLHGLGADGHDFAGIVPELGLPPGLAVRFIFPHAPSIPVSINQGMVMPAWYDIVDTGFNRREDAPGIRYSAQQIEQLIQHEIDSGIASKHIILAGFSQGGAIALHTALRYPQQLAGIIALSTYLPLAATLPTEQHPANRDIPILMMHGSDDTIVPLALANDSREHLKRLAYPLQWQVYSMAHNVCKEEIGDIGRWIERLVFDEKQ